MNELQSIKVPSIKLKKNLFFFKFLSHGPNLKTKYVEQTYKLENVTFKCGQSGPNVNHHPGVYDLSVCFYIFFRVYGFKSDKDRTAKKFVNKTMTSQQCYYLTFILAINVCQVSDCLLFIDNCMLVLSIHSDDSSFCWLVSSVNCSC